MANPSPTDPARIAQLLNEGRTRDALRAARTLARSHPKDAFVQNLLGLCHARSGAPRLAADHFAKAVKFDAGFLPAATNLAQALCELGQPGRAVRLLEQLRARHPDDPALATQLARSLHWEGRHNEALTLADTVLAAMPDAAEMRRLRARLRDATGDLAGAIDDYLACLAEAPDDVDLMVALSRPLALSGDDATALSNLEAAAARAPDNMAVLENLGLRRAEAGQFEAACDAYRAMLAQEPLHAGALEALSRLLPEPEVAALLPTLDKALAKAPKAGPLRAGIDHARGRALDARGDPEAAWQARTAAKRALARAQRYDPARAEAFQAAILARFPGEGAAAARESPVPVFVIGMIRSGTTLTEQVLAAHDRVEGFGELAAAGFLLDAAFDSPGPFSRAEAEALRAGYLARLPVLSDATLAFVDKMPGNYRYVGALAEAFPEARFVHVLRDPRDVALSVWREIFPATALDYTHDLASLAHHANLYRRTMAAWQKLYPERIHTLHYETLVQELEGTGRTLAAACGLEWQPAMLHPERNATTIRTASLQQARGAVHARSVGRWRAEADRLAPFIAGLDPALWPDLKG